MVGRVHKAQRAHEQVGHLGIHQVGPRAASLGAGPPRRALAVHRARAQQRHVSARQRQAGRSALVGLGVIAEAQRAVNLQGGATRSGGHGERAREEGAIGGQENGAAHARAALRNGALQRLRVVSHAVAASARGEGVARLRANGEGD